MGIDFGTTYSGFAYCRKQTSEYFNQMWCPMFGDKYLHLGLKTPTSLLLDDKNNFVAFGFDAEQLYENYCYDDEEHSIRFFRNFKMKLLKKEVYCFYNHK